MEQEETGIGSNLELFLLVLVKVMLKESVSIIIATLNEEEDIGNIIKKCQQYSNDIVIVDGHSTDKTREIAESLDARVFLDNKKGKGDAIRVGISKARNDVLVFIDADGSHNPDDIPKIAKPILDGRADHVSTSRMKGGSDELHGDLNKFIRMVGSDIITLGINYRFGVRLTDSQNGFRAIKRDVALSLGLKENIGTIEQELVIKTLKKGYKILEIPSHEYKRQHGNSRILLRRVWFRWVYSWIKYLFFN
ncbi:MAG: glycosyltransferase family 2 protein [Candidatus Omnitrophota bacterium]